jgi:hypothetical protein
MKEQSHPIDLRAIARKTIRIVASTPTFRRRRSSNSMAFRAQRAKRALLFATSEVFSGARPITIRRKTSTNSPWQKSVGSALG